MSRPRVLVTGATGFIAGHCVKELLENGYAVRGTVRDIARADVGHLMEIAGGSLDWQVTATGVWFFQNPLYPLPQQWTIRWSFPNGQSCGAVFTVTA